MKNAHTSNPLLRTALLIDAGFTPIGAIIGLAVPNIHYQPILALTAGIFLYVGASDLLPEVHKRFNAQVIYSVILGVLTIYGLSKFIHL